MKRKEGKREGGEETKKKLRRGKSREEGREEMRKIRRDEKEV